MRRAGEVVRTAGGLAIARVPEGGTGSGDRADRGSEDEDGVESGGAGAVDHPAIGAELVDESLSTVGRVVDVFGPVSRPYLAVDPDGVDPAATLGDRVYER